MKRIISLVVGAAVGILPTLMAKAQPFAADDTARISFSGGTGSGGASNADVINPQMSKNGRFVVFESTSTNLVAKTQDKDPVTLNGKKQVYLYDRQANSLELVSLTLDGSASPVDCYEPSVSNDGRYVAFVADLRDGSDTSNPTRTGKEIFAEEFNRSVGPRDASSKVCQEGDCNQPFHLALFYPGRHILMRDRFANQTLLASLSEISTARQKFENGAPKIDSAGFPEFVTETLRVANTRYDAVNGVAVGNAGRTRGDSDSRRPNLSGDGRFVVYDTDAFTGAGYRVGKIDPNRTDNFNVWTRTLGLYTGKYIAGEDGVVDTDDDYLLPGPLPSGNFSLSQWFDNNSVRDVFVRDGETPSTKMVSFDCRYHSPKPLRCDVLGTKDSINASISDDGRFIAFESLSWNFLSQDFNSASDAYVVEREKIDLDVVNLERISNNSSRVSAPNDASQNVRISADGRFVVYDSAATNIVPTDVNSKKDVFVYDRTFFQTTRCLGPKPADPNQTPAPGNGDSIRPSISGSGEFVAFESNSTNWGAAGGLFQAYSGQTSKDRLGRLTSCYANLASSASGSGGNGNSTQVSAAVIPRSATATPNPNPTATTTPAAATPTPETVRLRVASVAYGSTATDVGLRAPSGTPAADTNGLRDIFQAPRCLAEDLANDQDGDGTVDCFDMCWKDLKKVEDVDKDGDGVADCEDNCPEDPQKQQKGICGCGTEDVDSDFDRTFDCQDECPTDVAKTKAGLCGCFRSDVDTDQDGKPDCDDLCPDDRLKVEPGACGCGNSDFGSDGKLLVGCATPTPQPATPTPTATPIPFTGSKPAKPTLKRLTTRKYEVTVSAAGLPKAPSQYRVSVEPSSSTTAVSVVRSSATKIVVDGLRKGTYRVRYQAVSGKERSLFSDYSTTFRIR